MTGRSLQASSEGIQKAKTALIRCCLTKTALAKDLGISRQPIGKFFKGDPVDTYIFDEICHRLNLDVEAIVAHPSDIDVLVQEVRGKIGADIQQRCGTMRVLDMTQPIGLNDIYTNVNILEKIAGRRRKEIAELLQECKSEDFYRFGLGNITEERIPGIDAVEKYTKLIILGKPGSGKTTFLKYVAIQCIGGKFQAERVPIFVTLKDFAEATNKPSLIEYISHQFYSCKVTNTQLTDLLNQDKALVLLDGLDEVREEDSDRVLKEIRDFSDQFRENHFVLTCRIAAREYTFEKFTEVEISDFDAEQIATFATNWFQGKAVKAENFIKCLEDNQRIKELASIPLLLTLLCLAFEESGDFPANRSELYKEGVDALLKKWDAKRGIQRDRIYKNLSVQRKEDLLSKIALATFEQGDYFFKRKLAEQYITDYIRNLPDANTDTEALQLDSEVILRSIEAQHGLLVERAKGIYSYSHLTFHEFFAARELVVVKQLSEEALHNLVSHITDKRWREVFLLAVGMSPSADYLLQLMKQQVDALIADNDKLQQFLIWVNQKSNSVEVQYKPAVVRSFYFVLDLALVPAFDLDFDIDLALDGVLINASAPAPDLDIDLALNGVLVSSLDLNSALKRDLDPALKRSLQQLTAQLPDSQNWERYQQWRKTNSQAWTEQLRAVIINYRNIGHDWQFSEHQKELLKQYYSANKLLVDCLNSDCYASREVRQEIEDTLLLPIAEIKKLQQQIL